VERHARLTGSERAQRLLEDWAAAVAQFRTVRPRSDVARVESEHEGTEAAPAEARAARAGA